MALSKWPPPLQHDQPEATLLRTIGMPQSSKGLSSRIEKHVNDNGILRQLAARNRETERLRLSGSAR